jgi:hypothetical protein
LSDVLVFLDDPLTASTNVQFFSDPVSGLDLSVVLLCGSNFNSPDCKLPDGSHPDFETQFLKEQGIEDQVELTVYEAKVGQVGGPPCCGTNTFNIYSDGAAEPATWNLLALGFGAFAGVRRLRR